MWKPKKEIQKQLADPTMCGLDKVRLVIQIYAQDHGGNTPTYRTIAQVLDDGPGNIHRYISVMVEQGRVRRKDRHYWLVK